MGLPYFDRQSVNMRLDRTICMYQGEPVYISNHENEFERVSRRINNQPPPAAPANDHIITATKLPIESNKPFTVDYRVPEFSYKAVQLGYININGNCYYLFRNPMRQQRQGLHNQCIASRPDNINNESRWFTSEEMRDCILGRYPTLAYAEEQVSNYSWRNVAFSRSTAIKRESGDAISLWHRGRLIGHKVKNKYRLIENKETKALELLLKDLIPICQR